MAEAHLLTVFLGAGAMSGSASAGKTVMWWLLLVMVLLFVLFWFYAAGHFPTHL
jgi:hypothetical protein